MSNLDVPHPSAADWQLLCREIHVNCKEKGIHLSRCVVLLPFAQLMRLARRYWADSYPSGFVPQFQSSSNWANQLRPFTPDAHDISFEAARDVLTAASLVDQSGIANNDASQRDLLAQRLVEAAHQLASVAAAVAPSKRLAWAAQMRTSVFNNANMPSFQWLHWESALARLALAWASTSSYASDVLFDDAIVKQQFDGLFVLEGFQRDPLVRSLTEHWTNHGVHTQMLPALTMTAIDPSVHRIHLHKTKNAQDEAQRSAACVLQHIAAGRVPVALAATDRALTRRIRAMLATQNVTMRDENGWKLSTTRTAAQLMCCLSACAWNASADTVLDWLKNCHSHKDQVAFLPEVQVQTLEKQLRRAGVTLWSSWVQTVRHAAEKTASSAEFAANAVEVIEKLRTPLQESRPLSAWLLVLRELLQSCGLWDSLLADLAGEKVIAVLHLADENSLDLTSLPQAQRRISLAEFTAWVDLALESASFVPTYPAATEVTQVVILPMSQLFARPFAAVVLPGCDEVRLNPSPDLPGLWSAAERIALGLTTRDEQDAATRLAWQYAMQTPQCDVLWRTSESTGEPILPSSLVQGLALQLNIVLSAENFESTAPDPRLVRHVEAQPTAKPQPVGSALPVTQLSSSSYDKLRACPYQFFALKQLGLQENDELDDDIGKRDFGTWLHAVLKTFHEMLVLEVKIPLASVFIDYTAIINIAKKEVSKSLNLPEDAFLPWAATWPKVRDGYLKWLVTHEKLGWQYSAGEAEKTMNLGHLKLVGRIDRIDRSADGGIMVLDYKTESDGITAKRIKTPLEDTQLAFYGALMEADSLQAGYVNLSEKLSKTYEQTEIVAARDALIEGILDDMQRIGQGEVMPALGEGKACDYCAARGLCRKDFWS